MTVSRQTPTQLFKGVGVTGPAKRAEGSGAGQCWRARGGREWSAGRSEARLARSECRPQRSASTAQRSGRTGNGAGEAVDGATILGRLYLVITSRVTRG